MPPDALDDDHDDHQYASSEDSDFAPNDAVDASSDSGNEVTQKESHKPQPGAVDDAGAADYDNSGDEAIIERGKKRRRRNKAKGPGADDDDDAEGGLIKTRRQRAAEKEERKYAAVTGPVTIDVDTVWQQMLSGKLSQGNDESKNGNQDDISHEALQSPVKANVDRSGAAPSEENMIRIKRTYNFAGQVHTEEKLVARDSAEAKLYLASNGDAAPTDALPAKRVTKKAFRSAFEPLTDPLPQRADLNLGMAARIQAGKEAQAKKLNTVEKSRMDWAGYVDEEGIKDELELASKSKGSYNAREDFLARSEAKRDEDARRARMAGRA